MKIAVTGHRSEKIPDFDYVEKRLADAYAIFKPTLVITGGAKGVDLLAARTAFHLGYPFDLYRPWAGHGDKSLDYRNAMRYAHEVVNVNLSDSYLGPWLYHVRNEAMVNDADMIIAVWDGSPSGTHNCVKYASRKGYRIWNINPQKKEVGWL